jgi:phosphoribosylanthranilate isomerase
MLQHARIRVKICGITCSEDAERAVGLGADALGFNLFPGSKRYLNLRENAGWIAQTSPLVTKVAVLVNLPIQEALEVAAHPAIDLVQFHGNETPEYCAQFARSGNPFIKALRLATEADVEGAAGFFTSDVLLDAASGTAYGGTGSAVDLRLAAAVGRVHSHLRVILAGGLRPGNVGEAVAAVRPYAVDVASGVESEPRRKNPELMAEFIRAVARV